MILHQWRNMRIRNQILIFQSILIVIIFIISCSLSIVLFDKFQLFIKQELLEKTIIKRIISTTNTVIIEGNFLGKLELYQTIASVRSIANLYEFQLKNNIRTNQEIENCLQSPHQSQFYTYQFCSGIYGNLTNSTDLQQIKTFISLQNQFIPFNQLKVLKTFYNIQLDQTQYFSQYKGEYMIELKEEIKEAISIINSLQLESYRKQLTSDSGQILILLLYTIPGTKIAYGNLQDFSQLQQRETLKQIKFKQRNIGLLLNGFIVSDTQNQDSFGKYFQNTSITGFDTEQFDKIINFTFKKSSVVNECEQNVQDKYLCLIDINNEQKIIFPFIVNTDGITYIIVVIVDTDQTMQIRNQSYEQLQNFMDKQIKLLILFLVASFIVCLAFQLVLLLKLSQPLKQLENSAKYHINNQYKFLRILSFSY
ncbi:hypothetical protein pb186bvf_020969, partial [Paramecium bursaria]